MIYQISNPVEQTVNFICPDQATIDSGIALGYTGIFSIGGQTDANTILENNKQNWVLANESLFSVAKDIDPDPIQTTWIDCNLNTELPNVDGNYNVFNVIDGFYTLVIGLDNAKNLLNETKTSTTLHFVTYRAFETWLIIPKPKTVGTQTL